MGADLFESYIVILVATLILANTAFPGKGQVGLAFSLIVPAIGILASIIGIFVVRATPRIAAPWRRSTGACVTSAVLTMIGTLLVAQFYVHNLKVFWAVFTGVVLGQVVSRITEYYTSTETSPVRGIAESARTGPATTVLSGISVGPGVDDTRHRRHRHRHRASPSLWATATSSSSCTWSPWSASVCCPTPASSSRRTPSVRCRTTPPASPR